MEKEFKEFKALIDRSQSFVLATHINPDGDGLGSELALHAYLTGIGKGAIILNHSPIPAYYRFLDPQHIVHEFQPTSHLERIQKADVIIVLDTNQSNRLASLQDPVLSSPSKKVIIDHHLDAEHFADLIIIDDASAATGEIVYRILTSFQSKSLSRQIADSLYVAIMTDTGSFRFPKTDANLHRIIAHLIDSGADPVALHQHVYDQGTPNRLHLLGTMLSTLQVAADGRVAYMKVTQDMFRRTETDESDTDTFITYTLGINGVQIGLLFTELNDGVKISFRSRGEIWINELAKEFGGNGHKNAAGARVTGANLEEVVRKVLTQSKKYVKEKRSV